MLGVVYSKTQHELAIVLEYMNKSDLYENLSSRSREEFSWSSREKINYALQVAQALQYLHGNHPPIIHRDIKSRNILIDTQKGAKICDFGESRFRTFQQTMTSNVGTARWIAPEV